MRSRAEGTMTAMADIATGARLGERKGPPKFKRNLDPASCRERFRVALSS
jgi:hypothetical protein